MNFSHLSLKNHSSMAAYRWSISLDNAEIASKSFHITWDASWTRGLVVIEIGVRDEKGNLIDTCEGKIVTSEIRFPFSKWKHTDAGIDFWVR